jgi:hypothetical protein
VNHGAPKSRSPWFIAAWLSGVDRMAVAGRWSVHRKQGEDLQQMILEEVPNGADSLVEATAAAYVECFRHRDLHAPDVLPVPDRLQKRVGEPEVQEVLYGLLAEKMIDAVDGRLVKRVVEGRVESLRGAEVATERLFHDHSSLRCAARPC